MRRCRARELESLKGCFSPRVRIVSSIYLCDATYLATTLTHVRFFAGMNSSVHGQRRSLDELLLATRIIAHVRSDTTVDSFYHSW